MADQSILDKYLYLKKFLKQLSKVAVAFSGGLDSTFLLFAAKEAIGNEVHAYSISTPYLPKWEITEAELFTEKLGIDHKIINVPVPETVKNNPPDRCYLCKKSLFMIIMKEAGRSGIRNIVEGTHKDDSKEYRPGLKALSELKIISPLKYADLDKDEIRVLSRELNLPTWNKPSDTCLLTRIPYGSSIREEELNRIEKGEMVLRSMGFDKIRLRSHGSLARIEVNKTKLESIFQDGKKDEIVNQMKSIGYDFTCLDLEGYRSGSYDKIQNLISDESGATQATP